MKKILVLVYLVLQSCGSYKITKYNTQEVKIAKVLTITVSGDTIAVPIKEFKNQSYERNHIYYRNSWENTYYRPNYLYYNDLWLRNRYWNYNTPIYRIPVRPKVKPKPRPRPIPRIRPNPPRVRPNNPPRRIDTPRRGAGSTPRRVSSPSRRGSNGSTNRKQ